MVTTAFLAIMFLVCLVLAFASWTQNEWGWVTVAVILAVLCAVGIFLQYSGGADEVANFMRIRLVTLH